MQIDLKNGEGHEREPVRIPVPFLKQLTGLGSVLSQATAAVGVKPCEPCKKRAEALNQRVVFSPWET